MDEGAILSIGGGRAGRGSLAIWVSSLQWTAMTCLHRRLVLLSKRRGASSTTTSLPRQRPWKRTCPRQRQLAVACFGILEARE